MITRVLDSRTVYVQLDATLERAFCYTELCYEFVRELHKAIDIFDGDGSVGLRWLDRHLREVPELMPLLDQAMDDPSSLVLDHMPYNRYIGGALYMDHVLALLDQKMTSQLFEHCTLTWGPYHTPMSWITRGEKAGVFGEVLGASVCWLMEYDSDQHSAADVVKLFVQEADNEGHPAARLLSLLTDEQAERMLTHCVSWDSTLCLKRKPKTLVHRVEERIGEKRQQTAVRTGLEQAANCGMPRSKLLITDEMNDNTYRRRLRELVETALYYESIDLFNALAGDFLPHKALASAYRSQLYGVLLEHTARDVAEHIDKVLREWLEYEGWIFGETVAARRGKRKGAAHVFVNCPRGGMSTYVPGAGSYFPPIGKAVMLYPVEAIRDQSNAYWSHIYTLQC